VLFFLIRHGDPIYDPDSLTELGHRQAEALARRLAEHGLDEVYASTSNRAILTARPTCERLKLEPKLLDFANEAYTWNDLTVRRDDGVPGRTWLFYNRKTVMLFNSREIRDLGDRWYEHPELAEYNYKKGIDRIYDAADEFFAGFGYEHERYTGRYKTVDPSQKRVALFAHQGFGLAFLSCLLDIPYPAFCTHFDICPSGMTVIDFKDMGGYAVPKVLMHSADSHLYREGILTGYNGGALF